jgi:excisionase family DNA binding protein
VEGPGLRTPEREAVTAGGETRALLTATELAERWQVPVRTVYAWAKRNAIPHYRAGRLLRFDPAEVEEHFRAQGYAETRSSPIPSVPASPPSRC